MSDIVESGMNFSPCIENLRFDIEKTALLKAANNKLSKHGKGVKTVEFFFIKEKKDTALQIWAVEAKTAICKDTDGFCSAVSEKFTDCIHLFISAMINRHPEYSKDIPDAFRKLTLSEEFKLILIVRNGDKKDMPIVKDALNKALRKQAVLFGLGAMPVSVLNEEQARSYNIIE
ncbi:hypothetical protein ACET62_15765 [Aeromonas veronii]